MGGGGVLGTETRERECHTCLREELDVAEGEKGGEGGQEMKVMHVWHSYQESPH